MVEAEILEATADLVRDIFTIRLRAKGGRYTHYEPGPRLSSTWMKVAALCIQNELSPTAHVEALIASISDPYPNMLLGQKALTRTREYMKDEEDSERSLLSSQLCMIRGCLRVGESMVSILTNQHNSLSPALRYVLAKKLGFTSIASQFHMAAVVELKLRPKYRELLYNALNQISGALVDGSNSRTTEAIDNTSSPGSCHN